MQLISLGIIGEYIRLIFIESKRRPSYIIDDRRPRPVGPTPDVSPAAGCDGARQIEALP